jgi:RNA polymerase sigma factor (sigma-70 family)
MRNHEEAAFSEFYECYCDRLYRYLLVLTRGNEGLSRDLLQETMTKVMQRIRAFENEPQLWNWMAAIGRNTFIDWLRRIQRTPQMVPLFEVDAHQIAAKPADDSERTLFELLDGCLLDLEPPDRSLIEAFYLHDGSYQSLAEKQNSTAKAVESKLARLRQKLRAALFRRMRHESD